MREPGGDGKRRGRGTIGPADGRQERAPQSVGADKGYHDAPFVSFCREQGIAPHVAQRRDRKVQGLDGRTTRQASYQTSQKIRKRVKSASVG